MILRKDIAARVPVVLVDAAGAAVTGLTPADLNDSSGVGTVTVVKSDGTVTSIVLVDAVSWFEVDSTKVPGLYHVLLPTSATDIVGQLQLAVSPDAAAFVDSIIPLEVEEFHIATEISRNSWKVETSGPDANRLVIFKADGITPLVKFDLKDSGGSPTTSAPFERAKV